MRFYALFTHALDTPTPENYTEKFARRFAAHYTKLFL